jgi:hypothetical protein
MSPIPDPTVQLRPYGGDTRLGEPIVELKGGPWRAEVRVRPILYAKGANTSALRFMVVATWLGDPMPGCLPSPVPVDSTDYLPLPELELAKAVAQAAIDELRRPAVPDLRALARRFKPGL